MLLALSTLLAQDTTYDYSYSYDASAAAAATAAVAGLTGVMIFVWILLVLVGLLSLILWIWAIIDCAKRQFTNPSDKTTWLIVLIAGFVLGLTLIVAIIYLIVARKKGEIPGSGSSPAPQQPTEQPKT